MSADKEGPSTAEPWIDLGHEALAFITEHLPR
jgi:hypothetical protein